MVMNYKEILVSLDKIRLTGITGLRTERELRLIIIELSEIQHSAIDLLDFKSCFRECPEISQQLGGSKPDC